MSIEIKVTGSKVSFARWAFKPMAATWRSRIAPTVLVALKEEAPVYKFDDPQLSRGQKPGDLRNSIKLDSVGGSIGEGISMTFISDVPYATYVVTGTRGHEITPSRASLLHWIRGGESHFRAFVDHPGTKPNDFPKRAIDRVKPEIGRTLEVTVNEYIKPIQG